MSAQPTVWVPADAAAVSVGADEVAQALQNAGCQVRRNGSRGMLWLEPLVEVETPEGRVGYANVTVDEARQGVSGLQRSVGVVAEHPWLVSQQRVTFARVGVIEPLSLDDYAAHGGWKGLGAALTMTPAEVVQSVTESGLRGRGGAGFPAGIKWKTVADTASDVKFVCCNFDEGDSGTFADRMMAEGDPFSLIEGMAIAAYAVGAREGFIYLRSEYPHAIAMMRQAIEIASAAGYLGHSIQGREDFDFTLKVRVGAGAYICGEESSMLESLEGKRGEVRARPPLPAIAGLFGQPTVVNNVLTLCTVPMILADGAEKYAALGMGRSRGTQVFQLGGNVRQGGIVETAFGITLDELVNNYGGGTLSGRPVKAAQVGGPLGAWIPPHQFNLPMDYEAFLAANAMVGHGGIVVADDTLSMPHMAKFAMEFCMKESCGKCTPCRVGSARGVETLQRVIDGVDVRRNLTVLQDLCTTMTKGSLCAMGGLTPMPVESALRHWSHEFSTDPQDFASEESAR